MGRFLSPDGPFADQDETDPQSWNLYSYVRNNPLTHVDPTGQDCIYNNGDGTGFVKSGDCFSDSDSGIFVNGTVNASSFSYNAANNSSSFSYTTESGGLGTGVIQGPDLNGGFDAGSLGASVFGAGSASTWNPAAGTVSALGGLELGILFPGEMALAECASGGSKVACAANMAISIEGRGLTHVLERHTIQGAMLAGKGIFSAGEDVKALIQAAESTTPVAQAGGNFERVVDAGRVIGTDRATGNPTTVYTVITTSSGKLVTAFPGRP